MKNNKNITVDEAIKQIKKILGHLEFENKPLMKRPTDEELKKNPYINVPLSSLSTSIFYGSQMHTERFGAHETVWHFPAGIQQKLEDDKRYKVWYTWRDASDPADLSTYYHVYYIEEVLDNKIKLRQYFNFILEL